MSFNLFSVFRSALLACLSGGSCGPCGQDVDKVQSSLEIMFVLAGSPEEHLVISVGLGIPVDWDELRISPHMPGEGELEQGQHL